MTESPAQAGFSSSHQRTSDAWSGLDGLDLGRIRPYALLFPNDRRNALRAVYAAADRAGLNGVTGAQRK